MRLLHFTQEIFNQLNRQSFQLIFYFIDPLMTHIKRIID